MAKLILSDTTHSIVAKCSTDSCDVHVSVQRNLPVIWGSPHCTVSLLLLAPLCSTDATHFWTNLFVFYSKQPIVLQMFVNPNFEQILLIFGNFLRALNSQKINPLDLNSVRKVKWPRILISKVHSKLFCKIFFGVFSVRHKWYKISCGLNHVKLRKFHCVFCS